MKKETIDLKESKDWNVEGWGEQWKGINVILLIWNKKYGYVNNLQSS